MQVKKRVDVDTLIHRLKLQQVVTLIVVLILSYIQCVFFKNKTVFFLKLRSYVYVYLYAHVYMLLRANYSCFFLNKL